MKGKKAQIFVTDAAIATIVLIIIILFLISISATSVKQDAHQLYPFCQSALLAMKGNRTLEYALKTIGTSSAIQILNSSLKELPTNIGYWITISSAEYDLSGSSQSDLWTEDITNAEDRDIAIARTTLVTQLSNGKPRFGQATLRCWVKSKGGIATLAPTINEIYTEPSYVYYNDMVRCKANVTDPDGDLAAVYFTVNNSLNIPVINNVLGTQSGEIWSSPLFPANSLGDWKCFVVAVDSVSHITNKSHTFTVNQREGIIIINQ